MNEKGTCEKHGEFILREGCPQCMAERGQARIEPEPELEPAPELIGEQLAEEAGISEPKPETALVLRPGEDIEARGYFEDGMRLLDYAQCRIITTLEDNKAATDDLSLIAKLKKVMENKRRSLLDPLKLQSDAIRETYTFLMTPVLEAEKITKGKMLAYDAEQRRVQAEQEEVNRLKLLAAEKEVALNNGKTAEPVELLKVQPDAPTVVSTDMGTTGQKANWKWEVIDFAILPDAYKVVDGPQLTAIARGHHDQKPIPGIRFYNEPILAVRAR